MCSAPQIAPRPTPSIARATSDVVADTANQLAINDRRTATSVSGVTGAAPGPARGGAADLRGVSLTPSGACEVAYLMPYK
ncbi:hypothetical protein EVAR_6102_1 [Eumeta japonica]|uniref:Uncharacterized protein n=1 Tax=Eumeta variegata TaxID=151549 RepID=A0A4C1TGS3_EUMVA|nr:hypothetical protein EVAR_6102_1 [Eumeta japonica]